MKGTFFDVPRFEQALKLWEDSAFQDNLLYGLSQHARVFTPEILRWGDQFRNHLLRAATDEFDRCFELTHCREMKQQLLFTSIMGEQLHSWCKYSRNVFHVSHGLRILLQGTSFGTETWATIPWPFQSYAVTLEKAVEVEPGIFVDMVLYAQGKDAEGNKVHTFCMLPQSLAKFEFMDDRQRQKYLTLIGQGRIDEVVRKMNARLDRENRSGVHPYQYFVHQRDAVDTPLKKDPLAAAKKRGHEVREQFGNTVNRVLEDLARLVAGVALYLTTLPPGASAKEGGRTGNTSIPPPVKRDDPRLISSPAHVFRLTSSHSLSPDELEEMDEAMRRERTGMVLPHWRRGFFHRPMGLGHIPTAARTKWTHPAFVNRRHLPDGTLPGGAYVTVKTPSQK